MYKIVVGFIFLLLVGCTPKIEEVTYRKSTCPGYPNFMGTKFPGLKGVAFSTTENKKKGLWIVNPTIDPNATTRLIYQDSTWDDAGWLGTMLTDKNGNIWCGPIPVVNTLYNETKKQNTLWMVAANNGKMEPFITLPDAEKVSIENPFGILGITYNCEANVVYVSSVAGSTRTKQNGKLYAIDVNTKKIISTLDVGDAYGVGMSYKDGYRKLYFGSARSSDVFAVNLKEDGSFIGKVQAAFSVSGLGPRGDDIVRKLKEDEKGNLIVTGAEFKFNLTAPTEIQSNQYVFQYDAGEEKWKYKEN
jgi:hypothetical protein